MHVNEKVKKVVLLGLIALSFFPLYFTLSTSMSLEFHVSKTAAYTGLITLWWAYVLGVRRFIGRFMADMQWVMFVHKWFNIFGFLLLIAHPFFLAFLVYDWTLLLPAFSSKYQLQVTFGVLAFLLWALIWITSAIVKGKMSFRWWKRLHLLTYPILFLGFYHLQSGFLWKLYPALEYYNWALFISFALLTAWQIAGRVGIGISWYEVKAVSHPAQNIVTLLLQHVSGAKIAPQPGQYVYLQLEPGGESHPFSISDFDPQTQEVEVTIKDLGAFSASLQDLPVGTRLIVDGPYGVFLQGFAEKQGSLVFIAGGIGITPFVSVMRNLKRTGADPEQKLFIFHGSRTMRDMAFDEEIERLERELTDFDIVPVLDHDPEFEGEHGYICNDLIAKYVGDVTKAHYFLCGPPAMIKIVTDGLRQAGVRDSQIEYENFSA